MNGRAISFTALLATFFFAGIVHAAEPVAKSRIKGIAIGGHDTVAYHSLSRAPQAAALEGNKQFVVEYKGAKWNFISQESATEFSNDPEKYSPAYNGHCANALSLGEGLFRTDGSVWEIFGNQLYLFYAPRGRARWLDGNWAEYKKVADAAWDKYVR